MGVVIRQSFKATIVSYVGAVLGYVNLVFLYPLCLTPEIYGLTRVVVESATILAFFSQMGVSNAVLRFFPLFYNEDKKHHGFLFYVTLVPIVGFIFFGLIYVFFKASIVAYFNGNSALFSTYFYYILPLAFFIMYTTVSEAYSTVLMRIVVPKISREIIMRIIIAIVVIAYYFKMIDLDGLIAGFVVSYSIATLINIFYVLKIQNSSFTADKTILTKENKKSILPFLLYMLVAGLGTNVVNKIDTFMISSKLNLTETGIFSLAFFIATIIEMPSRSLLQILSPLASKAIAEKDIITLDELYKKSSVNQMLFACILFVFIWVNISDIFELMPNGNIYKTGVWVIFFIGLSKIFDASTGINVVIIGYSKYYYLGIFFIFFLAALTVLLNNILIPLYGITGASIATAISILLYNLMFVVFVWLHYKIMPFTSATLKTILLFVGLLLINHYALPHFNNVFLNGMVRSIIISLVMFPVIYFWKISPDFNDLLKKIVKMRSIKNIQKF